MTDTFGVPRHLIHSDEQNCSWFQSNVVPPSLHPPSPTFRTNSSLRPSVIESLVEFRGWGPFSCRRIQRNVATLYSFLSLSVREGYTLFFLYTLFFTVVHYLPQLSQLVWETSILVLRLFPLSYVQLMTQTSNAHILFQVSGSTFEAIDNNSTFIPRSGRLGSSGASHFANVQSEQESLP